MKIFFYIVCTLSLISLFACVQPVEPKTKTYEIPVPEEKEKIIYLILKRFGETFYTSSQKGAPKSISYFLYNYLNISNENMALLLGTPFSNVF